MIRINQRSTGAIFLNKKTPPHIFTLVILAGVQALNMNLFLPSLPTMAEYFNVSYSVMQLSISGYFAATAFLPIIIGPISDRMGRRPVMICAILIFILAAICCEFSTSFGYFLFFRIIEATIAAGMVLGRAIVRDMVSMNQAASMIGYITMAMTIMPMLGPAIGGLIEENFEWQASFRLMSILGFIALLIVWFDQGETIKEKQTSIKRQLSSYINLFKSKLFWLYSLTAGFSVACYYSFLTGAPIVAERYFQTTPSQQGYLFTIVGLGYILGNFLTGKYTVRIGMNKMMFMGCTVTILAPTLQVILIPSTIMGPLTLFGPMFLVGLGNGMTLPNASSGMVSINPKLAGSASGLGMAIMIGTGAALSAFTGSILGSGESPYPLIFMVLFATIMSAATSFSVFKLGEPK